MEETNIVLGPVTSLLVWRAAMEGMVDMPYEPLRRPDRMRSIARVRSVRGLDVIRQLESMGGIPLDVTVAQSIRTHVCNSLDVIMLKDQLPDGSLFAVGEGAYLCSPELCFVLLARGCPTLHLLKLGCELCGTYSIAPDQTGSFVNCPQLTTVAKLSDYVTRLGHRHGVRQARGALEYLADGADSPRETALYLLLTMPNRLGGYGFRRPELNGRVDISEYAQGRLGKAYLRCDQVYRDKKGNAIAVGEYDSNERHIYLSNEVGETVFNVEKILSDDERREAIVEAGAEVVTIRTEDTRIFAQMDAKAMRLGRAAGCEPRASIGELASKRMGLFYEVYDAWVWRDEYELLRSMAGYTRVIRRGGSREDA
jgi:hypothetical protein